MKFTSAHLNPYQQAHELLRNTPYFNKHDWETALNRGETDLQTYIGQISRYDLLPSIEDLEKDYMWSDMDFDQRELLMHSLLDADNTNKKTYDIITGYDDEGNEIKERFEYTEKEYYQRLLKDWSNYRKESLARLRLENNKYNADLGTKLGYIGLTAWAGVKELGLGLYSVLENVTNLTHALVTSTYKSIADDDVGTWSEQFREALSDDVMFSLFGWEINESAESWKASLMEWEMENTYFMNASTGERTSVGKYVGEGLYTIGQLLPAIVITVATWGAGSAGLAASAGAAGASAASTSASVASAIGQGIYYASMFEQAMQDKFRDEDFNSVSTGLIIFEAALKTGVEFLIEKGFSKFFGTTMADALKGVAGTVKKTGFIGRLALDAVQESAEEVLQETAGWVVDRGLSLIEDEFRTDITFEQLMDVAICAGVTSLMMGGFGEGIRAINYSYKSNKLAKANVNYFKLNNKKDRRSFRKALYEFEANNSELQQLRSNPKVGTDKKRNQFGLFAMLKEYKDIKGTIDVTTKKGKNQVLQLTKQLVDSYETVMSYYSAIGEERALAAESLLAEMNSMAERSDVNLLERAKGGISSLRTDLFSPIENLLNDADIVELSTILSEDKPPVTTTMDVEFNTTEDAQQSSDVIEQLIQTQENAKEETRRNKLKLNAEDLSNLYSHDIKIWNNHQIAERDSIIYAPLSAATNLTATELMKSAAERTVAVEFSNLIPSDIKNYIDDEYRSFSKQEDADIGNLGVANMLYNENFYWYLLNRSNESVYELLKILDQLSINIANDEITNKSMRKEYLACIKRIRKNMGPALAMYVCNNPNVTLENITVFNEEQRRFIKQHQYNSLLANRFIRGKATPDDLNVIINRIKSLPVDEDTKARYYEMFDSKGDLGRRDLIDELDKIVPEANYFGQYDNVTYKKGTDAKTARLNTYLKKCGIRYIDFKNGVLHKDNSLYDAAKTELGKQYNRNNVKLWLKQQFEQFTNGEYTVEFVNLNDVDIDELSKEDATYFKLINKVDKIDTNIILTEFNVNLLKAQNDKLLKKHGGNITVEAGEDFVQYAYSSYLLGDKSEYDAANKRLNRQGIAAVRVTELKKFESAVTREILLSNNDYTLRSNSYIDTSLVDYNTNNFIRDLLKIDDAMDYALTVNKIVSDPELYLKDDVIKNIRKEYGVLNKNTAAMYIKKHLLTESNYNLSIVLDNYGNYVPEVYSNIEDIVTSNTYKDLLQDKAGVTLDEFKNTRYGKYLKYEVVDVSNYKSYAKKFEDPSNKILYFSKNKGLLSDEDVNNVTADDLKSGNVSIVITSVDTSKLNTLKLTDFIDSKQLYDKSLKEMQLEMIYDPKSKYAGLYKARSNTISINLHLIKSNTRLIDVIVHEYQHAVQTLNSIQSGGSLDMEITKEMIDDVLEHVPELKTSKYPENAVRMYLYKTISGEQISRGTSLEYDFVEPTTIINKNGKDYFVTAWGAMYEYNYVNSMSTDADIDENIDEDVDEEVDNNVDETSDVTEERELERIAKSERTKVAREKAKNAKKAYNKLTPEQKLKKYEDALNYESNIDEALQIVKSKKKKGEKIYKYHFSHLKLPKEIVNAIISGTYSKSTDTYLSDAKQDIRLYKQWSTKELRKSQVQSGRAGEGRSRQVFKRDAEGTNLMYWYMANPDKIPEIHPAVQEFVLSATDFSKLDNKLVKHIKSGRLTIWDIHDYIRNVADDDSDINEYTFNELKKAFFKNTPFTNFTEIQRFIESEIPQKAYAVLKALNSLRQRDTRVGRIIDDNIVGLYFKISDLLSNDTKRAKFDKLVDGSFLSNEKARKIYTDAYAEALSKFGKADILTEKGVYLKDEELFFEDAKADVALGLLRYFDGTLSSLDYVANNARHALIREKQFNKFFTYTKKKGTQGQSTLSFDQNVSNKKSKDKSDKTSTLGDIVADKRQTLDDVDTDDVRKDINDYAIRYYGAKFMRKELTREETQNAILNTQKLVKTLDEDSLLNKYAIILTLDDLGITFDEALAKDIEDLVESTIDDTVIEIDTTNVEDKSNRTKVYKRLYSLIYNISPYLSKKSFNLLPDEFKKYFDPDNKFRLKSSAVKDLTAEQILELIPSIKELNTRIRNNEFINKKAKRTAERQRMSNERMRETRDYGQSSKKPKEVYTVKIEEDVRINSTIPMPEVLKKIMTISFKRKRKSKVQFAYDENIEYLSTNKKEFLETNAELLKSLTRQDVLDIINYFDAGQIIVDDFFPFESIKLFTLAYIANQERLYGRFDLPPSTLDKINQMHTIIRHHGGQIMANAKNVLELLDPEKAFVEHMLNAYGIDMSDEPEVMAFIKAIQKLNDKLLVKVDLDTENGLEVFNALVKEVQQRTDNIYKKALVKYKRRKELMSKDMPKISTKVKRKNILEVIDIINEADITIEDAKRILKKKDGETVTKEELKELRDKSKITKEKFDKIKTLLGDDLFNYMVEKHDIKLNKDGTINKTRHELRNFLETLDAYVFSKKNYRRDVYDKILKFQKAMMLANVPTVFRGKISNLFLGGFDFTDKKGNRKHIGGINDAADIIGSIFKKSRGKVDTDETSSRQYNFSKIKVSNKTAKFVKEWIIDTDLLSLTADGLTRYDIYSKNANTGNITDQLTTLIINSTMNKIYGKNTYNTEAINKVVNFVFKLHSDDKFIINSTLRYIGKMIEHDNIDISRGMTDTVMNVIADAYSMAAYEYMHKRTFISNMLTDLRNKYPEAHFVLNLVEPFLASGWTWFVDTLKYNPVALGVNLIRLSKLQEQVDKMDEYKRRGDVQMPSSRFTEMLVRRDIGKGVIGTSLILLGFMLGYFGKIRVDRDDEKLKLFIGDSYWIDFSNIYGATPILIGAELSNPNKGDAWTVIESALNQQFEDSVITSLMNTFRNNGSTADYFASLPTTIASSFIPNVWKAVVKSTNTHKVDYDEGFLGNLEYFAVSVVPFIERIMPKGIDPYTGEWESRYNMSAFQSLLSYAILPIKIKPYNKSDVELAFDEVDLSKKPLKGEYKDLGKLNTEMLNEFYGKLNNKRVTDFINDKTKRRVLLDNGKYKELYYSQMSNEQKRSALDGITKENAEYAKIYTWTKSGHKYYCSSAKRKELLKLGINTNIYIGNKGFVK